MAKRNNYMRVMLSDRERDLINEAAWLEDNTPRAAWVREQALVKAQRIISAKERAG